MWQAGMKNPGTAGDHVENANEGSFAFGGSAAGGGAAWAAPKPRTAAPAPSIFRVSAFTITKAVRPSVESSRNRTGLRAEAASADVRPVSPSWVTAPSAIDV